MTRAEQFDGPDLIVPADEDPLRISEALRDMRRVERFSRRQRNKVYIAIIVLGMVNFLAYTFSYAILGGDAHNGDRRREVLTDGTESVGYFVRGHFIRGREGREREVTPNLWIYSYAHSITVPVTSGAMVLSMLLLARPHILATMRDTRIGGGVFLAGLMALVIAISLLTTLVLAWQFAAEFRE